jgi:7-cyano-7-deazaguanine reductase
MENKIDFRTLPYGKTMEDMPEDKLRERIQLGMDFEIPHKIRPVPYLGVNTQLCEYTFPELEARCPVTGIKDQYIITFRYIPDQIIPELKSLKLYLWDYEECFVPISHEHLASKLYNDFKAVVKPKDLYVELIVAGRGELFTTVRVGNMDFDNFKKREYKNL